MILSFVRMLADLSGVAGIKRIFDSFLPLNETNGDRLHFIRPLNSLRDFLVGGIP
jgi:hypothetical protein